MTALMKYAILTLLGLLLMAVTYTDLHAQNRASTIDEKVDSLMQQLSLTDKIGEMTQLSIDMLSVGEPYNLEEPHRLDEDKLRKVLLDLRVGSILNVGGHAYSREHWHEIIGRIQEIATKQKPTGIPVLYGIDTIHGANYTLGSTLFPQQIGIAATWDTAHAYEGARIGAYETRASWIPWTFAPVLDIGRDYRWPRFWETFGEDVLLTKKMGNAMVRGFQGDDVSDPHHVAATMKHFLGYSLTITGKDRTQAWIPERQLREYVLPPFKAAVDAGALTVMINSGELNGIPVHVNKKILTGLLRDELGFEGIAVTDWADIEYLYTRHMVAENYKEAIKMAINAGIDMAMVPVDLEFPILLKELVEAGEVPMKRIDESVRRILWVKFKLGLFEKPYHTQEGLYDKFGSPAFAEASYQAAAESITLLKNEESMLPLSGKPKVLVTGPAAHTMTWLNGGWSRTWQGDDPQYLDREGKQTILEAVREQLGFGQVKFVPGTTMNELQEIEKAVSAASDVDLVIACLGEAPYTEKPGDLNDLHLPEAQRTLVKRLADTGKPIVLVLVEGRPRVINDIEPLADAILMAYLPGNEGGRAITDILFGKVNPSGKLPFTYPRYVNDLVTYDHNYTDRVDPDFGTDAFNPQWEFGHGLSYTRFDYSDLKVKPAAFGPGKALSVSVTVTNSGSRAGMEVVQVYVSDLVASVTPPVKRLRAFEKVDLEPGESRKMQFTLYPEELSFVGLDMGWVTEPGDFVIQVDTLSQKVTFRK